MNMRKVVDDKSQSDISEKRSRMYKESMKMGSPVLLWLVLIMLSCLAMGVSVAQSATVDVQVSNFQFTPATVEIQAGDTVRWVWSDSGHSTTSGSNCSPDGVWDSGVQNAPFEFSHTFSTPGSFPYFCIPHCSMGMVGTVVVSGTPPPGGITASISPASLAFTNVAVGQTSDQTITITNDASSTGALTGTVGDLSAPFSVTSGAGDFTLQPGQSVPVTIQFAPTAAGDSSATLQVTHNASNPASPISYQITGNTGTAPPPSAGITVTGYPASIDFGSVPPGRSSQQRVTIGNDASSNGSLAGTAEVVCQGGNQGETSSPYTIVGQPTFSLTPGQTAQILVQFQPASSADNSTSDGTNESSNDNGYSDDGNGSDDGTDDTCMSPVLQITHNATNVASPLTIPITGTVAMNGLNNPVPQAITASGLTVGLMPVADGLVAPNWGIHAPGDGTRLYVVDQAGPLWVLDLVAGTKSLFADLTSLLVPLGAFGPGTFDERGFLGIAFHPDYQTNGLLYTFTSEPVVGTADFTTLTDSTVPNCQSVVREWRVPNPSDPASVVDPGTSREILRIDKPQFNHNGGAMNFGPDGMLYISLGDGGNADDQGPGHSPQGNGQDTSNILGDIIRIDPTATSASGGQYGVPADNPFVQGATGTLGGQQGCADGFCDEIYAYGFRNPWRTSFDQISGLFFVADVGQNDIEEIDVALPGFNYGWRLKEGSFMFEPNGESNGYVTSDRSYVFPILIDPVAEFDHDEGNAAIGGFVYYGQGLPAVVGRYIFGTYSKQAAAGQSNNQQGAGRIFILNDFVNGTDTAAIPAVINEFTIRPSGISEIAVVYPDGMAPPGWDQGDQSNSQSGQSNGIGQYLLGFGQDAAGEIYVLTSMSQAPVGNTGVVWKIVPPEIIAGTSGTAGTPGTSGTAGTAGTPGSTGTSGTADTSGSADVSGTAGTSGTTGTSGAY